MTIKIDATNSLMSFKTFFIIYIYLMLIVLRMIG